MVPEFYTLGDGDLCTLLTCPLSRSIFDYQPKLTFAAFPLALFAALAVSHGIIGSRYKSWSFMAAMVVGCLVEVGGYIGRVLAHGNPFITAYYMVQICLLTMAPVFFCAAIYLSLSRIVNIYGSHISRIKPVWYTRIFLACDFLSLVLQATGGALAASANTEKQENIGVNVMLGALSFQVFTLLAFSILCLEFAWRVGNNLDTINMSTNGLRLSWKWTGFLWALAIATALIIIRCIYRVAEMAGGYEGAIIKNQTTYLIFEGVLIILASLVLLVLHPGPSFACAEEPRKSAAAVMGIEAGKKESRSSDDSSIL